MKERLLVFIRHLGMRVSAFEKSVGLSNAYIQNFKGNMSAEKLERILKTYPQLNETWLLTGQGDMLKNEESERTQVRTCAPEHYNNAHALPLVPIDVIAGFNGIDEAGVRLSDCPQYYIPEFRDAKADFLIKVSGSSMYPKYSSGDILACRYIREVTFLQWGKVYVIDSQQGAMVKRLYEIAGDNEHVLCKSDNEDYPPFKLPKDEIRSLSIVVGVIRLE